MRDVWYYIVLAVSSFILGRLIGFYYQKRNRKNATDNIGSNKSHSEQRS